MFKSARLKLTGWYLFIIMFISLSFSIAIYRGMVGELERGFRRAELRFRAEEFDVPLPQTFPEQPEDLPLRLKEIAPRFFLVEDLEAARKRLLLNLLMINSGVLVVSALAGYFLAGKTLRPIEKAMEEQKRFVADASHELLTPLTALKTSMEVALRDKKLSLKESKKVIKSNLEDIDGLQSLSNNLLSLAHYQNNGQNLSFKKVDATKLIKKVCRKVLPLAKKKKIKIEVNVRKQTIWANEESFEEMMLIFLDNAIKYTPKNGKITIETKVNKKSLLIKIKDTGLGIAKEDLPHIFDRFYRVDQSRSKSKAFGFGLGLSLARKIIEIHQGTVAVSSVLKKGTTFTIKFPLKRS